MTEDNCLEKALTMEDIIRFRDMCRKAQDDFIEDIRKEERKRIWEELARISEQVVINESSYVQIPSLLFRWAFYGEGEK